MSATDYLVWGVVAHIVADWLLQNDWMAVNKPQLTKSLAGWVHGGIHFVCLSCVFPVLTALVLALVHIWIDTRTPLVFLRSRLGQGKEGNPVAMHVAIWHDQVVHVVCIAVAALMMKCLTALRTLWL